jgi:hypothetical protein
MLRLAKGGFLSVSIDQRALTLVFQLLSLPLFVASMIFCGRYWPRFACPLDVLAAAPRWSRRLLTLPFAPGWSLVQPVFHAPSHVIA